MKNLIETIKTKYAKLKSVTFVEIDENTIQFKCKKNRGENACTTKQFDYINSLDNVQSVSNNSIRTLNKWAASALIELAKENEKITFVVSRA